MMQQMRHDDTDPTGVVAVRIEIKDTFEGSFSLSKSWKVQKGESKFGGDGIFRTSES